MVSRVMLLVLDTVAMGERIRQIRKNANKTQQEFAEIIDTSVQTVSNAENGVVIPNIQTLVNIAEKFEFSLDMIVGIK